MRSYLLIVVTTFTLYLSGCTIDDRLPTGKDVVVQFDRSALGAGASLPISPTTNKQNGAETSLSGKLIHASADWIQLEAVTPQGTRTYWIPRSKILLIQFTLPEKR